MSENECKCGKKLACTENQLGQGDLDSSAKGTGARYNKNKTPYEYLPLSRLQEWLDSMTRSRAFVVDEQDRYVRLFDALTAWHSGHDEFLDTALWLTLGVHSIESFAEAAHVFKDVTTRAVNPYKLWNWRKGMPWLVPFGCAMRHLLKMMADYEFDDETGRSHMAHLQCNLIMLLEYRETMRDLDNRYKDESIKTTIAY